MSSRRASARTMKAVLILAVLAFLVALGGSSHADSRVDFLATRLQYPPPPGQSDDFRVRTNAALALGATNDDAAVNPLCGGLSDPSDAVRTAAAVALRKLGRSSALDCLKRRLAGESSSPVKTEIQRSIDALAGAGAGGAPPTVAGAKFYVAISSLTNNSGRPSSEVEPLIRGAITSKLADLGGFQLAPSQGETPAQAKAVMSKRNLKGYYLSVSVDKLDYSGGNLRVKVKIAVFSYPDKDLRGEVPASASIPGATPGDKSSEDMLMKAVAARATELFAQNFQ